MITEYLLFAVHAATVSNRPAGVLVDDHCLPIACSHASHDAAGAKETAKFGFHALWESAYNPEEFFGWLNLHNIEVPGAMPNGLWVYTVEYEYATPDPEDDEDWEHLTGGELRRPALDELEPFTQGQAPWGGKVL